MRALLQLIDNILEAVWPVYIDGINDMNRPVYNDNDAIKPDG